VRLLYSLFSFFPERSRVFSFHRDKCKSPSDDRGVSPRSARERLSSSSFLTSDHRYPFFRAAFPPCPHKSDSQLKGIALFTSFPFFLCVFRAWRSTRSVRLSFFPFLARGGPLLTSSPLFFASNREPKCPTLVSDHPPPLPCGADAEVRPFFFPFSPVTSGTPSFPLFLRLAGANRRFHAEH